MLEPLLAIGRGRRDSPGEVGGRQIPMAAQSVVPPPDGPELSVVRPQLQEPGVRPVPPRQGQGPLTARTVPAATLRQELQLPGEVDGRLVPARLRQPKLAVLRPEGRGGTGRTPRRRAGTGVRWPRLCRSASGRGCRGRTTGRSPRRPSRAGSGTCRTGRARAGRPHRAAARRRPR